MDRGGLFFEVPYILAHLAAGYIQKCRVQEILRLCVPQGLLQVRYPLFHCSYLVAFVWLFHLNHLGL